MRSLKLPLAPMLCSALLIFPLCASVSVSAQSSVPLPLVKAAAATELPLGPWGPYSQKHLGPCCLVNRAEGQMFAFPIVIGQQRDEVMLRPTKMPDGKTRLRPAKVVALRRAMGLSAVNASADTPGKTAAAKIMEADADGLMWITRAVFAPAPLTQAVVPRTVGDGTPIPSEWGGGTATTEAFPVFTEQEQSGLLIRVTLTNTASQPQSFFVDLLGGVEQESEGFPARDLNIQIEEGNAGMLLQHPKSAVQFAVRANGGASPVRCFRVRSGYFSGAGNLSLRSENGDSVPYGSAGAESEKPADDAPGKQADSLLPMPKGSEEWGLTRISDIQVEPGQSRVIWLSLGMGTDAETAQHAAGLFLRQAGAESGANGGGIYDRAPALHRAAAYASGDSALDRLTAQSLADTPFHDSRRVGVATRESAPGWPGGAYRPGTGGWIALGWSVYRPDWSAAQLNAWFLTQSLKEDLPPKPLPVPPIDTIALWELFQKTHDKEMLERFYPAAKRRFLEFVEAGRVQENGWLFAWPAANRGDMRLTQKEAEKGMRLSKMQAEPMMQFYAPDYSAYVLCTAKIMRNAARILNRPQNEIDAFTRVLTETGRALNESLWDSKQNLFAPKAVMGSPIAAGLTEGPEREATGLECLLPLIAGPDALTPEQNAALLKRLTDETAFWSEAGLRSVSKVSAGYRPADGHSGAIHYGAVWLFWKALLDRGEGEKARVLAARILRAYHEAAEATGTLPEYLNGDTGKGGGRRDYTGDACALLPLHAAYHTPGTVTTGWELHLLDFHYEKANDTLRVVFRLTEPVGAAKPLLVCALGKPGGKYTLTGALTGEYTADETGALTLPAPRIEGTQQIEIVPSGAAK